MQGYFAVSLSAPSVADASRSVGALAAASAGFLLLTFVTDIDIVWRVCLGIGAIPGICTFYFRVTMHETERFVNSAQSASSVNYKLIFKQ